MVLLRRNGGCETELLTKSIMDMAVEAWRFRRVFELALEKLDAGDRARYRSQFSWFLKKVRAAMENAGLRAVDLQGQPFDVGMAVTPLNLEDFAPGEALFVEQMPEPVVMDGDAVVRTGTVILGRVPR